MIKLKRIFPECDADTFLVQLIFMSGQPAHNKGISKVATALEKYMDNTHFIVGLIDNDKFKNIPPYLKNFKIIEQKEDINLTILKLENTQKHLIRIHPAFEKWIWNVAESCAVNPSEYGFNSWENLKDSTKGEAIYDDQQVKKFIKAVIQENPPAIQTLRHWLSKATVDN